MRSQPRFSLNRCRYRCPLCLLCGCASACFSLCQRVRFSRGSRYSWFVKSHSSLRIKVVMRLKNWGNIKACAADWSSEQLESGKRIQLINNMIKNVLPVVSYSTEGEEKKKCITHLNHSYLSSPDPSTWHRSSTSLPILIRDENFGETRTTFASLIPETRRERNKSTVGFLDVAPQRKRVCEPFEKKKNANKNRK